MHPLPGYIAIARRLMFSLGLGARAEVIAARSSSSARVLTQPPAGPVSACSSPRSLSTSRWLGPVLSTPLAGWPNVPLHVQRKVLAWSRSPNAEEALVVPPPSVLAPSTATAAAAVSNDVNAAHPNNAAVTFSLNGNGGAGGGSSSSSSTGDGLPDAAADMAVAEALTAEVVSSRNNCAGQAAPSSPAATVAAATQNGNGAVPELVYEAMDIAEEQVVSSSSNGNGNGVVSAALQAEASAVAASVLPGAADAAAAPQPAAAAASPDVMMDSSVSAAAADAADASGLVGLDAAAAAAAAAGADTLELASTSATAEAATADVAVADTAAPAAAEQQPQQQAPVSESVEAAEAAGVLEVASSSSSSSSDAPSSGGSSDAPSSGSSSSSDGSSSSSSNGFSGGPAIRLALSSGAAMLPHPDKASRGGEDSFFIADHEAAVGVADGVGGWAEIGVDAGAYARLLMVHAKEAADAAAEEVAAGTLSPQAILESAFYRTNVQGSSTACVLVVNGTTLSASNLGDSGFVLVRDGVATFQCPQQQHNFNFPFQLGSADSMSDQPQAAMRFELQLQPGDIIVTGSDGLWDNIFAEEAATIASKCRDKGETATTAAQVLCRYARMRASDAKYHSPFSYAAIQAGYVYLGGKMDDITVVVSYVTLPQAKL